MDSDQQVRLDFLIEAEEYFNNLESLLIDLDAQGAKSSLLDKAMRSAHSLKGGAAMMRFVPLSKIAHRLEDFLKILRVRKDNNLVDQEVTTLLLRGVDCMRAVRNLHQQQDSIDESWLASNVEPIFERLHAKLGDLNEADEDRLLAEEEQIDVSSLIFQSGVEECLESFQAQLDSGLELAQLKAELEIQTEQLTEFGMMSQIEPFVQLCQSVQQQILVTPLNEIRELAQQALKLWLRSHALVLVGRVDKLPTRLNGKAASLPNPIDTPVTPDVGDFFDPVDLEELQNLTAQDFPSVSADFVETDFSLEELDQSTEELYELHGLAFEVDSNNSKEGAFFGDTVEEANIDLDQFTPNTGDLADLNAAFTELDHSTTENPQLSPPTSTQADIDLDQFTPNTGDLADLNAAFTELDTSTTENLELPSLTSTEGNIDLDQFTPNTGDLADLNAAFTELDTSTTENLELPSLTSTEGNIDLDQFTPHREDLADLNAAFAQIAEPSEIVAKSTVEPSKQEIMTAAITGQAKLESGRTVKVPVEQLQRLNDLSSRLILERNAALLRFQQLEDFVTLTRERMYHLEQSSSQLRKLYDWAAIEGILPTAQPVSTTTDSTWKSVSNPEVEAKFDALEMDRYNDLHLLSQSQMETIVQLQEVTTDIDFGVQEMGQVIRDFSYTARELQQNIMRSQMRPFAELVGRFPRLIRDLSASYHKEVELVIEGKTTQIDRQAMEYLSDPLTHLLRNAFDHGLEDNLTRQAAGKPAVGKIILKAIQQGNQTIITVTDDGRGINTQKIRDRLAKMGLSSAEINTITDEDVLDAIFEPGFSTVEQVTELSGRGVGMDVVRSNLQQIRGDVQVNTELGKGTTFTIAVPLSLRVLRVIVVESGGLVFAIPVDSIKEIIDYDSIQVTDRKQQEFFAWQEKSIHLIRPQKHFKFCRPSKSFEMVGTPKIDHPTILIFEEANQLQGIYLEKYWNEQEVAIRNVKTSIDLFAGCVGSTILGDGRVIPLIEPHVFYQSVIKQHTSFSTSTLSSAVDDELPRSTFPVTDTPTILIVDDSVHVRRYLARFLESNGYLVEAAKDGQEAVDKLQGGLKVKALICDVEMPRLDGYGVLSEIKSEDKFEHLPIAMLTSRSNDKHRKLAMKLGAAAYFSKPFNEQEMLQTLQTLIAHSF